MSRLAANVLFASGLFVLAAGSAFARVHRVNECIFTIGRFCPLESIGATLAVGLLIGLVLFGVRFLYHAVTSTPQAEKVTAQVETTKADPTSGLIFGEDNIDAYRAEVIHTYLGAYHRTYNMLGFDSLLRTIQSNSMVSGFRDIEEFKTFKIPGDLDDFQFYVQGTDKPGISVNAYGVRAYQGFQVLVALKSGKYWLFLKEPTPRAANLANLFQTKYGAIRRN